MRVLSVSLVVALQAGCALTPMDMLNTTPPNRFDDEGYLVTHHLEPIYTGRVITFRLPGSNDDVPPPGLRGWTARFDNARDSWFFLKPAEPSAMIRVKLEQFNYQTTTSVEEIGRSAETKALDNVMKFYHEHPEWWGEPVTLGSVRLIIAGAEWESRRFAVIDRAKNKRRVGEVYARSCPPIPTSPTSLRVNVIVDAVELSDDLRSDSAESYRRANAVILKSLQCRSAPTE